MSPATTTETPKAPAPSLGSFLGKLTPPPPTKPAEDAKAKEPTNTEPAQNTAEKPKEGKTDPLSTDQQPAKVVAPVKADQQTKAAEAPKETTTDTKLDTIEKQLKEQTKANLNLGKENADLRRTNADLQQQLKRIEQKLDGTYEEPTSPTPEQVKSDADLTGRIRASHHAAVRQYGEAFVMETVWNTDSPYQELQAKSPRLRARVMEADDPVLEAIAAVKEHQDAQRYGATPEEIRKKLEAELIPKITQEVTEGLKTKPGPAVNTLSHVRGDTERTQQKNEAPSRLDFRAVFPWGASRT